MCVPLPSPTDSFEPGGSGKLPKQPFQPLACGLCFSLAFPLREHTAEKRKAFILRWAQDKGCKKRVIRWGFRFINIQNILHYHFPKHP